MAAISNILLSRTYINEGGNIINFKFDVSDTSSLTCKYQIYLGETLLKENILTATPYSVNEDIMVSSAGTAKIVITNSSSATTQWTYNIILENRDTFTIDRRLKYDNSITMNNTKIISGSGVYLSDDITTGEFLLEVPTVGKAKLSTITVTGNTDGIDTQNITKTPSTTTTIDTSTTEYGYPINKTLYDSINSFTMNDDNSLVVNVSFHSTKKFQLSKDGITFVGYNGTDWSADYKMTEAELEALNSTAYAKFHTTAYEERLFIKTYMDSNNTVNKIYIDDISSVFAANEPPIVNNLALSLTTIHSEETSLSAYLYDNEGDTISYRVMRKKPSDSDFVQITPANNGDWITVNNKTNINHTYSKTNFEVGNNDMKIQVKDSRGAIKDSNVLTLIYTNQAPIQVSAVFNDFSLQALVDDANKDTLAYRVFINGVQKFPATGFTPFQPSPRVIEFTWDSSDVKFGLNNEIKLEITDGYGGNLEIKGNVVGTYKGLLFKDEKGQYYTTDSGQLLKYIDLGSNVAGSTTMPVKVFLQNHTGDPIANVTIRTSDTTVYEGIDLQLSSILSPFDPSHSITIPYTLNDKDEVPFYLRVKLDRHASKTGEVLLRIDVE